MVKIIIPILLVFTVVVAGLFAFIPVQEAATVHTVVMANTMRIDEIIVATTAVDLDLVITCPADSDGCKILELYMRENDAAGNNLGDIDLGALNGNINSVATTIQLDLGTQVSEAQEAIAGLSGTTFGGSDTITVVVEDGTSESDTFSAVIFIEVEGNQSATAIFQ